MRQYFSLADAIPEIRRDLTRALPHKMKGVQQDRDREVIVQEALNYVYSVPLDAIPPNHNVLFLGLYQLLHPGTAIEEGEAWWAWLEAELDARWGMLSATRAVEQHPLFPNFLEGEAVSYLYPERFIQAGGLKAIVDLLLHDPETRRAYLPVYHPMDTMRAVHYTRIPCSLGYHFLLREDGGVRRLHMTYYMRACDFDTFWLTDVWLAAEMAHRVIHRLGQGIKPGNLVHDIVSFHLIRGADDMEEIY